MRRLSLEAFSFHFWAFLLGFAGYAWVLNNGFISDDVVFLDQSHGLAFFPEHVHSAPSAFRLAADLWFGGLQALFGYHAAAFYVFSILLHVLNALWLRAVLLSRRADQSVATLAAVLFVVIQNPAEAIAWLSAVNELLVAFILLATLWTAQRSRYGICLALFVAALVSKESSLLVVLLLPLFLSGEAGWRQKPPKWFWLAFIVVSVGFLAWFVSLMNTNPLIQGRFYSLSSRAVLVLAYSLHKLAFPWIYVALLLGFRPLWKGSEGERREALFTGIWLALSLFPYIFVVYDTHVPSRHLYLAAMPCCYLVAQLISKAGNRLRWAFVIAFAVVNIGYLWTVKDRQFIERGRTIQDLVTILSSHPPGCAAVDGFPENPWVAKLSARLIPGWSPQMIHVNESTPAPENCLTVKWDRKQKRYETMDK